MASIEGPAPNGGELFGGPAPSLMTDSPEQEVPKLTPERAQQELARLTAIIKDNPSLHFLEPRVIKCVQDGVEETHAFLSFYRLISQSLSEELVNQKERIKAMESDIIKARQLSAQSQMEQALSEASLAVNKISTSPAPSPSPSSDGTVRAENSAQVDELLKRLEQAENQRERLLQDMQNMRNRAKTDVDVKVFKAVEKFTQSLLPALDAFHQAMPSLKTATDTASIVTGIEMIHEQLQNALIQAGLKRMEVVGQKFDPRFHEAIGEVETWDVEDDHIYDELQPGYEFGERMIRAAIVRIARNTGTPPAAAPPEPPLAAQPSAAQAEPAVDAPTAPIQVPPVAAPAVEIQAPAVEAPAPTPTVSAPLDQPSISPAPQASPVVDAPTTPMQVPPVAAPAAEPQAPVAETPAPSEQPVTTESAPPEPPAALEPQVPPAASLEDRPEPTSAPPQGDENGANSRPD